MAFFNSENADMTFKYIFLLLFYQPRQQTVYSVCHLSIFCHWVDGRDYFENQGLTYDLNQFRDQIVNRPKMQGPKVHFSLNFKTQHQNRKLAIRKMCFATQVLPLFLFIFLFSNMPNQILELFSIISLQIVKVSEKVFPSLLLISYSILCL